MIDYHAAALSGVLSGMERTCHLADCTTALALSSAGQSSEMYIFTKKTQQDTHKSKEIIGTLCIPALTAESLSVIIFYFTSHTITEPMAMAMVRKDYTCINFTPFQHGFPGTV